MAAAVRVRGDYEAAQLRRLAKQSEDAAQTRRLLALAAIYDGGSRTEAARIGGVGLQTVRDWVLAFNAEGPSGLVNGKALGNAPLLSDVNRQALMQIVESGPIPAVHGVVRWRLIDLVQWVFEEFRISISKQTLIPDPAEPDSRRRFPNRREYDSPWQARGGLPWRQRFGFGGITRPRNCAGWRSSLRMPLRRGACWHWRLSMTADLEPRPPGSAVSDCKRCGIGY